MNHGSPFDYLLTNIVASFIFNLHHCMNYLSTILAQHWLDSLLCQSVATGEHNLSIVLSYWVSFEGISEMSIGSAFAIPVLLHRLL